MASKKGQYYELKQLYKQIGIYSRTRSVDGQKVIVVRTDKVLDNIKNARKESAKFLESEKISKHWGVLTKQGENKKDTIIVITDFVEKYQGVVLFERGLSFYKGGDRLVKYRIADAYAFAKLGKKFSESYIDGKFAHIVAMCRAYGYDLERTKKAVDKLYENNIKDEQFSAVIKRRPALGEAIRSKEKISELWEAASLYLSERKEERPRTKRPRY